MKTAGSAERIPNVSCQALQLPAMHEQPAKHFWPLGLSRAPLQLNNDLSLQLLSINLSNCYCVGIPELIFDHSDVQVRAQAHWSQIRSNLRADAMPRQNSKEKTIKQTAHAVQASRSSSSPPLGTSLHSAAMSGASSRTQQDIV